MNTTLKWPEDYQNWKGSFDELVSTAAKVLETVCPEAGAPTTSLVRYYQQQSAVGRGKREGRGSIFTFSELAEVVASKQMVSQQVPLAIAREVMQSASMETIYLNESSTQAAYHPYTSTPASAASVVMNCASPFKGTPAEQLVAKLMNESRLNKINDNQLKQEQSSNSFTSSVLRSTGNNFPHAQSALAVQSAVDPFNAPPGGVLRYSLAHGVNVEIPVNQKDRHLQAQTLREFADQLHPPHPLRKT